MTGSAGCGDPKIVIEFDNEKKQLHIELTDFERTLVVDVKILGDRAPDMGCLGWRTTRDFLLAWVESFIKKDTHEA